MDKADIGMIGLGVMARNLVLNLVEHGYRPAVYNRTVAKVDEFLAREAGSGVTGCRSPEELVSVLRPPRRIMLMIKAGRAVDRTIAGLAPLLSPGDIIIDGGNSFFRDTERRTVELARKGLLFVGCGISGGAEGARHGPALMPGGSPAAWPHIKDMFRRLAAEVDGIPCCDWLGEEGAGHYVKMVHNGIEYADMQLICEAYDLMRTMLEMSPAAIGEVFAEWNRGVLDSYLVHITARIMAVTDLDGSPLLDKILDVSGEQGTGRWAAAAALEAGVPLSLTGEAIFARFLSTLREERRRAAGILPGPPPASSRDRAVCIEDIRRALYGAKIVSCAQGFMLLKAASQNHGWRLDLGGIAMLWRGGCIIRSSFLGRIKEAFGRQPELDNFLLADYFRREIEKSLPGWRRVAARAVEAGIPLPAMAGGLAFYDGYRRDRLPANLLQAQRDYFGAHTYERVDRPRGEFFHTDWTDK